MNKIKKKFRVFSMCFFSLSYIKNDNKREEKKEEKKRFHLMVDYNLTTDAREMKTEYV